MEIAWTVILWIGWVGVAVVAGVFTVLFLAFADSPDANKAAQRAASPGFTYAGIAYVMGFGLMAGDQWWSHLLAYALAASPPVVMLTLVSHFMKRAKDSPKP